QGAFPARAVSAGRRHGDDRSAGGHGAGDGACSMTTATAGTLSRIAVPPAHLALAVAFAFAWGLANVLGWALGHEPIDVTRTSMHFVYEALVPMLLLAVGLSVADAYARDDDSAIAPYAIAAVTAAIVGQILFTAAAPLIGLDKCGCNMDR